jgi:uncharacterized protein YbaR (Trm112 family)
MKKRYLKNRSGKGCFVVSRMKKNIPLGYYNDCPSIKILSFERIVRCPICKQYDYYFDARDWKKVIPKEKQQDMLCIRCYNAYRIIKLHGIEMKQ